MRDLAEGRERGAVDAPSVDAPVVHRSLLVLLLVEVDDRFDVRVLVLEIAQGLVEPLAFALRIVRVFFRSPLSERERLARVLGTRPSVPRLRLEGEGPPRALLE